MGIGPWAQGELIRDIEKAERARFRRALTVEEKYLNLLIREKKETGGIMRGDLEGAFRRIRSKIAPKPKKTKAKRPGVMTEACHGF